MISDLKFIYKCLTNKEYRQKAKKASKQITHYIIHNFKTIIKEYWIWYLLIIIGVCLGWTLSAKYYQNKCNTELLNSLITTTYDQIKINLTKII